MKRTITMLSVMAEYCLIPVRTIPTHPAMTFLLSRKPK
jgi:hypothetical protein